MPLCVLPYVEQPTALDGGTVWTGSASLPALHKPQSAFVESLRSLRTSLLLSNSEAPPCSLLITSPLEGEGKSFLSWNLAILFAQQGKRVLLCDANLRHPTLHRHLKTSPALGLTTLLTGHASDHGASVTIPVAELPGLFLIPAGPVHPHPAELLASHQMQKLVKVWESQYDVVLFDAPPVLQVTDSVVLGSMVDSVLLVAWHQRTPLSALESSFRLLEEVQPRGRSTINIVINGAKDYARSYPYHEREVAQAS